MCYSTHNFVTENAINMYQELSTTVAADSQYSSFKLSM